MVTIYENERQASSIQNVGVSSFGLSFELLAQADEMSKQHRDLRERLLLRCSIMSLGRSSSYALTILSGFYYLYARPSYVAHSCVMVAFGLA